MLSISGPTKKQKQLPNGRLLGGRWGRENAPELPGEFVDGHQVEEDVPYASVFNQRQVSGL